MMRERHKHLVGEWKEVTDPLKHVFEVLPIYTFCLRVLMFPRQGYWHRHVLDTSVETNLRAVKRTE